MPYGTRVNGIVTTEGNNYSLFFFCKDDEKVKEFSLNLKDNRTLFEIIKWNKKWDSLDWLSL